MKLTQTHYALLLLLFGAVTALLIITSRGGTGTAPQEVRSFTSVPPTQFEERMDSGEYIVIDIRTPEEIAAGKIVSDALEFNYYLPTFRKQLESLDRDDAYLIYCNSGNRSGEALKLMRSLGFTNVHDLKGGKVTWERSGRSLVSPAEGVRIACPTDAKLCPDGSSVGRTAPGCEFAPCA